MTELTFDEHQVIPMAVINQLANKLALHREGHEQLNRFHHLRLCLLMLMFALGRRISEILMAPRGTGPNGPLAYYPAKGSGPEGALWFQFSPNKHGPQNHILVSSEWVEVTEYCVRELIRYSDEIREAAGPKEQELLILISRWNLTSGPRAAYVRPIENIDDFRRPQEEKQIQKDTKALSYDAFHAWLHGKFLGSHHWSPGILEQWKITIDGTANGEIYKLRTHQARHTRQSAIASDPQISPLTKKRDLNHINNNMQFYYQHNARTQNELLLEKAKNGQLIGPAMEWFSTLFSERYQSTERQSQLQLGQPLLLSPRWRNLIQNNPQFMQFNRVPCGYCVLPQGPGACDDYMNCTEAEDGGCTWFLTDPENPEMLIQITQRVRQQQQKEQESIKAGREVQAEKQGILARRSALVEKEVLHHCDIEALPNSSQDLKERLKARRREIEEDGQ